MRSLNAELYVKKKHKISNALKSGTQSDDKTCIVSRRVHELEQSPTHNGPQAKFGEIAKFTNLSLAAFQILKLENSAKELDERARRENSVRELGELAGGPAKTVHEDSCVR